MHAVGQKPTTAFLLVPYTRPDINAEPDQLPASVLRARGPKLFLLLLQLAHVLQPTPECDDLPF